MIPLSFGFKEGDDTCWVSMELWKASGGQVADVVQDDYERRIREQYPRAHFKWSTSFSEMTHGVLLRVKWTSLTISPNVFDMNDCE